MSVLTYQEVTRRIEELTRSIFELDPFYVMEDDPAVTLAMLVSTADRARLNRRPRSPERRETALRARSPATPAWLQPGTTYAEIVKGQNSRSSSINSRHHSAQRLTHRVHTPDHIESEIIEPVIKEITVESVSPEITYHSDSVLRQSSPNISDRMDYSETVQCHSSESDMYSDNVRYESVLDTQNYLSSEYQSLDTVSSNLILTEGTSIPPQARAINELQPPDDRARSLSPATKYRSQDLSYAEILALGLKKQPKTHIIMSLPKPQVAHVEMVKEITVEVEKAPQPIEQKTPPPKYRTERPERPQRSRSRDMPRQRRAPEKRATRAHDTQTFKKKRIAKKVMEVKEFDDAPEIISDEVSPYVEKRNDAKRDTNEIETIPVKNPEIISCLPESKNSSDIDEKSDEIIGDVAAKKQKKRQKQRRIKPNEDEIEKALKEIEQTTKQKKKKSKGLHEKAKGNVDITNITESPVSRLETSPHADYPLKITDSKMKCENIHSVKEKDEKVHSSFTKNILELNVSNVSNIESKKSIEQASVTNSKMNKTDNNNEDTKSKKKKKSKKNKTIPDTQSEVQTKIKPCRETDKKPEIDSLLRQHMDESNINAKTDAKESIITLDWNTLMEEEKNIAESPVSFGIEHISINNIPTQVATEVDILPERNENITDSKKIKPENILEPVSSTTLVEETREVSQTTTAETLKEVQEEKNQPSGQNDFEIKQGDLINFDYSQIEEIQKTASEVHILQERNNTKSLSQTQDYSLGGGKTNNNFSISKKADQNVQNIDSNIDDTIVVSTVESEQNNNYKLSSPQTSKEVIDVVQEVQTYEPKEVDTHTIYLITHEEKKLPPIRTVKVFTSKEGTSNKATIMLDGTQDKMESCQNEDNAQINVEEQKALDQNISKAFNLNEIIKIDDATNTKSKDTTLNEIKTEVALVKKAECGIDLPEKQVDQSDNFELEEVIFGSVQDRKKPLSEMFESSIPYQALRDEVKTYSMDLDFNTLEYNFYKQIIKTKTEDKTIEASPSNILISQSNFKPIDDERTCKEIDFCQLNTIVKENSGVINDGVGTSTNSKNCVTMYDKSYNYQDIDDSESLLATLATQKLEKQDVMSNTDEPSNRGNLTSCISYGSSDDNKSSINTENGKDSQRHLVGNLLQCEIPKQCYYDMQDAEKLLAFAIEKSLIDGKNKKQDNVHINESKRAHISPLKSFEKPQNSDEKQNKEEYSFEQATYDRYEINQAEKQLAILKTQNLNTELDNINMNTIENTDKPKDMNKNIQKDDFDVLYYSYSDLSDAEKLLGKISLNAPREAVDNSAVANECKAKLNNTIQTVTAEPEKINNCEILMFDLSPYSYYDIMDAEMRLAKLLTQKQNDQCISETTPSPSAADRKTNPNKVVKDEVITETELCNDDIENDIAMPVIETDFEPTKESKTDFSEMILEQEIYVNKGAICDGKDFKDKHDKAELNDVSSIDRMETSLVNMVFGNIENMHVPLTKPTDQADTEMSSKEVDEFLFVDIIKDNNEDVVDFKVCVSLQDSSDLMKFDNNKAKHIPIKESSLDIVENTIKVIHNTIQENSLQASLQLPAEECKEITTSKKPITLSTTESTDSTNTSVVDRSLITEIVSKMDYDKIPSDVDEDFEIISTQLSELQEPEIIDFNKPHPISAELEFKPQIISIDAHQLLQSDTSGSMDTEQCTDLDKLNMEYEIISPHSATDSTRVEKSPIHSLHDLLPEIDSIPEFKPSYPNPIPFFSKLSADAPEFTPSYMYKSIQPELVPETIVESKEQCSNLSFKNIDCTVAKDEGETCSMLLKGKKEDLPDEDFKGYITDSVPTKRIEIKRDSKQNQEIVLTEKLEPTCDFEKTKDDILTSLSSTENAYPLIIDDNKSYADVVADSLLPEAKNTEYPDSFESIAIHQSKSCEEVFEKHPNVILAKEEANNSWAKIAATKCPSNVHAEKIEQQSPPRASQIAHKAPVILVDEAGAEYHKVQKEVDAEGFITVERSRRSRSKSRDVRSTSVPKMQQNVTTRDKSENRFDALCGTLKADDVDSNPSVHSEEEQQGSKPKQRKSRSSKSKDKSVQVTKVVETKKKEDKSKECTILSSEYESANLSVTISQPEKESKKKPKKKKKNKKSANKEEDITCDESPVVEVMPDSLIESQIDDTTISSSDLIKTSVSTPDSMHTPVKDRFYSDAQFWKVDATQVTDIDNLSETLMIELDVEQKSHCATNAEKQITPTEPITVKEEKSEVSSQQEQAPKEFNISEELSLECKMADLQREIEEMLLPENDNSVISDITPKELIDSNASLDEQDEISDNMSPSLASPEPDDYQQLPTMHLESKPIIETTSSKPIEELLLENPEINDSLSINNLLNTNTLNHLKTDTFWIEKSVIDDAETRMIKQILITKDKSNSDLIVNETDTVKLEQNLMNDSSFWPEKYLYHDAECHYFQQKQIKLEPLPITDMLLTKDDNDKDRDPGSGSGHSSDVEEKDPLGSCGSPFDSNYMSMDLPGGICSWKDQTSYLSVETPTDSLLESVSEDLSRIGFDISEDSLTTPTLEPVASPRPPQEQSTEAGPRTTKDELSNDIESLLEDVKIVQANLTDLPNESLEAMEQGLKEGISILVKCEEAAAILEQKVMEYRHEQDVQNLLKDLVVMKARIAKLLIQARQGLITIQDAKKEIAEQNMIIEEQKQKITKLDRWLETINNELKESTQQSEVLNEDNILRYIEIYERYIREYEEYKIILKSISLAITEDSSHVKEKINITKKTLEETKNLVINEIERLREILMQLRSAPEVIEEDISQTDRTIDSTSMPEEIVTPRDTNAEAKSDKKVIIEEPFLQDNTVTQVQTELQEPEAKIKTSATIETQTGQSLMSDKLSVSDKSVICQPDPISTHDVSITCAPPKDIDVQTSEPVSQDKEILENILIKKTISDGHETIEIESKPVIRAFKADEKSLVVGADYEDTNVQRDSTLNIIHSLPQSFETVMVEPDETTTEVVVDADGTKRIIVKKVRKTLVTRQKIIHSQQRNTEILSTEEIPQEQTFSQITLTGDKGLSTSILDEGVTQNVQYQLYGGEVLSQLPSGEVTIQEFTSKPDMIISLEKGMKPDDILQLAEGEIKPHIETSSSSITAVVQQVTKRIIRTRRRIIRKVVIIDGKEHVTEEVIDEPENIEVSEEQIPRVSINVRDDGYIVGTSEPGDDNDKDNDTHSFSGDQKKPPGLTEQHIDTSIKTTETVPETNYSAIDNDDSKKTSNQLDNINIVQESIQNENLLHDQKLRDTDSKLDSVDVLDSNKTNLVQIEEELLPGLEHSAMEMSFMNTSSVMKQVTRRITKSRKRIIKHITIINGKEHVTEEVIEEPDDVETIEEEPTISYSLKEQGSKRVRSIKRVKVIDGKEHVTEEIIEDSGDENEPTTVITPEFDNDDKSGQIDIPDISEGIVSHPADDFDSEIQKESSEAAISMFDHKRDITQNVGDIALNLDSHEMQSDTYLQAGHITEQNIANYKQNIPIESQHLLKSEKEATQKLSPNDESKITINKELSKESFSEQETNICKTTENLEIEGKNSHIQIPVLQTKMLEEQLIKRGNLDKHISEVTKSLLESEIDHGTLSYSSKSHIPQVEEIDTHVAETESSAKIIEDAIVSQPKPEEMKVANLEKVNFEEHKDLLPSTGKEHKDSEIAKEPCTENITADDENYIKSQIIRKRRKVIKRTQIVDGREHVTEEVIEEPDDVITIDEIPETAHVLQEEGLRTKRIKVIRQVQVVDGKQHVTEQVIEEPTDDYTSDSTVTADINLTLSKPAFGVTVDWEPFSKIAEQQSVPIETKDADHLKNESKIVQVAEETDTDFKNRTDTLSSTKTNLSGYELKIKSEVNVSQADEVVSTVEDSNKANIGPVGHREKEIVFSDSASKQGKDVKTFVDQLLIDEHQTPNVESLETKTTASQNTNQDLENIIKANTLTDNVSIKEKVEQYLPGETSIKDAPFDKKRPDQLEYIEAYSNLQIRSIDDAVIPKTIDTMPEKIISQDETDKITSLLDPCQASVDKPRVESILSFTDRNTPKNSEASNILRLESQDENACYLEYTSPSSQGFIDSTHVFLQSERMKNYDDSKNYNQEKLTQTETHDAKPIKTSEKVDITMSITKPFEQADTRPMMAINMAVEKYDSQEPFLVKKDIDVQLPSDVKISHETSTAQDHTVKENVEENKQKKKKTKRKARDSPSEALDSESNLESDKSVLNTESSSLGHYVELPPSTPVESPKPTLQDDQPTQLESSLDSENVKSESLGYKAENASMEPSTSPEKKKKHKKRKSHRMSEDTLYPIETPPEDDIVVSSSPAISEEPAKDKKIKGKKSKKKIETLTDTDTIKTPSASGQEVTITSPKEESYHTLSETSDISTVKVIEECVGSSPDSIKEVITTTVTYPVPVVEEIPTQEYSVQTSPDLSEVKPTLESPDKVDTIDVVLQTSPTPVSEIIVQTTPIEDRDVDTQTNDDVKCVDKVEVLDLQVQTSRTASPEEKTNLEATTQVVPTDISLPDEKSSQTTPSIEQVSVVVLETDSKEIQTSPILKASVDEKSTEIIMEVTDSNVQTIAQENTDQETNTSPVQEIQSSDMSIQTLEIPAVNKFTQSEEEYSIEEKKPITVEEKATASEVINTTDTSQQTSPRIVEEEAARIKTPAKKITVVDTMQQTTPREEINEETDIRPQAPVEIKNITVETAQQTTPRELLHEKTPLNPIQLETRVDTVDIFQQTSPRSHTDDSISTSTDEPFEVHLRAQISIPRATNDFLENERQTTNSPLTLASDKQKLRKRKRRKPESPLKSPESLSDPINAELSLSVTPTSDDLSSKDSYSIDEGISQYPTFTSATSREPIATQARPTYSDVVQRSKSKSPSPNKIVLAPKTDRARLLNSLEKRTLATYAPQKDSEDAMTVALVEPAVEKSYDVFVRNKLADVKTAVQSKDPQIIEKTVIIVIETISIWLEEMKYKIHNAISTGVTVPEEANRIKDLERHIEHLREIIYVTEVHEEIVTLIETLTRQMNAVSHLGNESISKVRESEEDWRKFLNEIESLSKSVDKIKTRLEDLILLESPTSQELEELDKIENDNNDNLKHLTKMFKVYRSLAEANPKRECPTKLYLCDDDTRQIENAINVERDRLLQLGSLAEEYEQTLQDFGQITEVAEALLDGKIIVSNLDHLHEEIQKHRKFFVNLSHCRAILESLEDNLDNETRAKYASLHHSLHDRATAIIDRAAGRAQQMTLAASRWSMLDQGMKEELQWLRVAEQRIPDLTNVTSMDHEQYINLYQSLSLDVSHHYAKMLRLLSITEGLQNLIVCPGLDSECSVALETLLKHQENIDVSLIRLTDFKENWFTYDHLVNRIEGWIKLANREIEQITPENITTTSNLRRFWELKAQHEVHNNLKNECSVQFEKALEILPISDEMVQRQFFCKIEDKWRDLSGKIGSLHASAIQSISDRDVTSTEKLNLLEDELRELRGALEGLKGVIKSEDELNLYIERLQVMTSRIDRIQNELGRLSLLPTAESERLGALLSQSGILDDQIAEELERSMLLKEKIVQVQAGIGRVQKSQRRARLTLEECGAAERLGSDVVERASQNCEKLLEDLASQWKDILALRQALHTLPISLRVCVSPTSIEREISALQETHAELEAACNDLSVRLRSKLQLWRRFERQLELVQGAVREADYMVELLTVQGQVDYDRLLKATERLETLSESLSRRSGELVGELRETATPLEASTEPSVAAKLKRQLDDAAAAYEHTCANLTQLCDKYHKAVDLWSRYRDAAAAVRAFTESQEGRLHALRPDDAPATAHACLEQEARVAELRSLAARVAAETGSRALQADADALAKRLQLVAGAVQALADLGEARQSARAKAQHAKEMFCDMRQDLTPVHEDGEIVEDKLIALRDNLIALGKSEADIAPAKAELPDIDRDVSDEHSIVRILELWQAMFRDTFLHYHRLSTALVRSGDAATAFKLWHEYLLDLQSFLSGSVPADYENLTEHRRLCRVHRNLLASQRSVLINENRDTNNRDLADKFDTLTNLHNETLAKIVERHDEVSARIAAWDDYREIYTELLRWLKELEREKEKLQLRYVHIKRINKTLTQVQNLSDRLPEGRKFSEKLFSNLKKVLVFTEDTYGASVRMEYAGIVKRVDNLQASLDTWRDFLTRILGLIGEYESLTGDLQKLYSKTQNEVMSYSDEERLSRPQLKKAIDRFTDLRTKIDRTETQIEALSVIQEQLKECLSPQDIRIVNQKVWQLRQQRADLEHQLSIIIHRLQERIEIYTMFDSRLSRFSEWLKMVESRFESTTSCESVALDPHDLIKRINSDIQADSAMKEREFEWLTETGMTLVELSKKDEKSFSKNTCKQLKDIQDRWHTLQESRRNKIAVISDLLKTISQLEERLTEIRTKLHGIESKLSAPVILEELTIKAVDSQYHSRDDIHKEIEKESEEVGNTLNLCEFVTNDPHMLKDNVDLRNLRTGVDIVEKKWKNICEMSEQRKSALTEIRKSAELANSLLPKVEKKLDALEKRVEKIEARKHRGESEDEAVSKAIIEDLDNLKKDINRLKDAYSRIVSARGIEVRGNGADDAARLRAAVRRWQQLRVRVDAAGADAHRQFVAAHGKAVVALAEADVRLTRALHLSPTPTDKEAILRELEDVEREVQECECNVKDADRLATAVMSVPGVPDMVAEYRALYTDVRMRLDIARAEVVGDVDTAVQVDTLRWETDAALQVDTLTSKETYRVELASAVKEASEALESLRTALLHEVRENAPSEELANAAKEIAKAGTKPSQTLELAKHLSELLLTECDATENEAMLKEVESLSLRYEDLLNQAKKRELQINNLRLPHSASYALTCEHESGRLTCPLCSDRNWKQLDNDLWRLEQWLQFAEATHEARNEPPEQYDVLEDTIQDHREFLLDLDSHKALVVSLNVVGSHVARHARDTQAADRVRERLADANRRWDEACARAADWQTKLQRALVHNREFHDIVVELVSQLGNAERLVRSREPLRLSRPANELRSEFRRFSELRDELSRAEPRVLALRDAAQLLQGNDAQDVCRRLGELRLRLQSLRKLSAVYALKLGAALANQPSATGSALAAAAATLAPQLMQEEEEPSFTLPPLTDDDVPASDETEERSLSGVQRGLRFVCRVARASLPFQALLLLLLGAAALAPHTQTDCRATPSLQPVLRYPDGPPPI
ncbi:unnamed protein product [Leptosia nina]|uniref:KASH domain-containing protein n=1 Tax=Leptosia nina TaxID=320188 RepID=A0AAV1IYE0_9NEOP